MRSEKKKYRRRRRRQRSANRKGESKYGNRTHIDRVMRLDCVCVAFGGALVEYTQFVVNRYTLYMY